jgi:hypothetical protein
MNNQSLIEFHRRTSRRHVREDAPTPLPRSHTRPIGPSYLALRFERQIRTRFPARAIHPAGTVRFAGRPMSTCANRRRPVQGHPRGFRSPPCRSGPDRQDYFSNDAAWDFRRGKDRSPERDNPGAKSDRNRRSLWTDWGGQKGVFLFQVYPLSLFYRAVATR